MTEKNEYPAELSGAYALDALSPEESAEFEAYLTGSEQARIEAEELGDTAVALGLATEPVQPSAALKAGLMARLASTPQLAPLEARSAGADAAPVAAVAPPAASAAPTAVPVPAPAAAEAPPAPAPAAGQPRSGASERARLRWFQRPVGALAAAAAAVALFVGAAFAGQAFNTNQFQQEQAAGLARINAASDSQRASTLTSDGHPATLVWSGELGLSALLIEDLPALPSDKDYQLWYMNDAGAFPAGTFDSAGSGTVWRVLEGTMKAGDQVGVTVEPEGGSPEPTSDPVVAIQS